MTQKTKRRGMMAIAALFGALICLAGPSAQAQPADPAMASAHAAPATAPSGNEPFFAAGGTATCMKCHGSNEHVTAILKSPMGMKGDPRTPFGQNGCESCHGPSGANVAGFSSGKFVEPTVVFKGPHASPVEARNKVCLSCHQDSGRINWQGSAHQHNDVACATCHTAHAAKDPILVKLTQPEKCFTCHKQQRAESFEYSHHPIREGKVVCSDCHNPHGSAGPKMVKEFTVNETCYNCHADKRGPMLFEHQPVRENCLNCHTPHGSTEARLMKDRMNFMCASCHSAISNGSGGAFGGAHAMAGNLAGTATFSSALANNRACLNCHSQVHGSNSPNGAYFFR